MLTSETFAASGACSPPPPPPRTAEAAEEEDEEEEEEKDDDKEEADKDDTLSERGPIKPRSSRAFRCRSKVYKLFVNFGPHAPHMMRYLSKISVPVCPSIRSTYPPHPTFDATSAA